MNKCTIHPSVVITNPCNLYGCLIQEHSFVGPFVEIQKNVFIGKHCRISSHTFICEGVEISDNVFVGHGVVFTNDIFTDSESVKDWKLKKTTIGKGTRIGSNATILPVHIGENCIIGAGAVVTKNVPNNTIVKGNPAN